MGEDTVVSLPRPGGVVEDDRLLCLLREGARRMLMQAIQAEVDVFVEGHADLVDDRGRKRIVRNGHAPERRIQTGIGPIEVQRPRVRDRGAGDAPPIRFTSAVLPAYLRRTKNVEELLPWLYLKGVSTGQFEEALTVLLGRRPAGCRRPRSGAWSRSGRTSTSVSRAAIYLEALCLCLGGRRLFQPQARTRSSMHPGFDGHR